jgi:hypothetical protein
MMATLRRAGVRKTFIGLAIVAALLALASSTVPGWFVAGSRAAPSNGGVVTVAKGAIGPHHWLVRVAGDGSRKGICLETSAYLRRPQYGGPGNGTCSAPAVRRGSITSVFEKSRGGRPTLTVLGAAFNLAVDSVEVKTVDGRSERLLLRRILGAAGAGPQVAHFRYAAKAVAGRWCVRELVTRSGTGAVLWRASGSEVLPYDPATVCSGTGPSEAP